MVQIISSANSVYDIPWPTSFSSFLDVLKVFLVDLITITKVRRARRSSGALLVSAFVCCGKLVLRSDRELTPHYFATRSIAELLSHRERRACDAHVYSC
jgi:hypothetical protein